MRKWLVGLAAAGLCAASAWAETVTYTVESTSAVSVTGTAPEGASAEYSSTYTSKFQLTAGNSMTLTLKGFSGTTITGLTLSMKSNASKGAGSLSAECGDATIASIAEANFSDDSWNGAFSSTYVDVTPSVTKTIVNGDIVITIAATVNSLYCQSFTIDYEAGAGGLTVSFDQSNPLKIDEGTAASVTAIATGGEEPYQYLWESDVEALNGTEATLTIPVTLAVGTNITTVTVKDNAGIEVIKPFAVIVQVPVVKYPVRIAVGVPVTADKEEAIEGETVTLTAHPAEGYKLEHFLVNDSPIQGNTFKMPAGEALVSASFVEKTGLSATYTVKTKATVEATGDVPEGSSAVYSQTGNTAGQATASNSISLVLSGYEGTTITGLTLSMKSNSSKGAGSLSVTCGDAIIASIESSKFNSTNWHGDWSTEYVDIVPEVTATAINGDVVFSIAAVENSLYLQSVTVDYEAGAGGLRVSFDQSNPLKLDEGTEASVTAIATGGEEPYQYLWESDVEALNGTEATLPIPATLAVGTNITTVTVKDNAGIEVTKPFAVIVNKMAVPHDVKIAVGISGGHVTAEPEKASVGEKVTLTAKPEEGKKLESMTVTYGETTLTFSTTTATFDMPDEDVYVGAKFVDKSGDVFKKISSADELEAGDYVFVGSATDGIKAMQAALPESGTKYFQCKDVEIENDEITGPDDDIVWTLAKVGDNWTIYNSAVGYVSYPGSGNAADADAEVSEESSWAITYGEDKFFIVDNVATNGRYLRYNTQANAHRFACYTSVTLANSMSFYKKAGATGLRVSFDQSNPLKITEGTAASVTAIAAGGEEPYQYLWESDIEALNGTEATLAIPATLAVGTNITTVTVKDNAGIEVTKPFAVIVSALPKEYTVEVADGILHGTVEISVGGEIVASPATVLEGTKVTVVATPEDRSYKVGDITVKTDSGADVELAADSSFTMPAANVWISASFVEITGVTYTLVESEADFEVGAEYLIVAYSKDKFTSALKNEASTTRIGVEEVVINEDNTIVTDSDAIVWTIQKGAKDGEYVLFNAAKGVYAAGPSSEGNNAQLVADGSDALAQWTLTFDEAAMPKVGILSVSYSERWLARNSTAAYAYFATYKGSGTQPYLFKKAGAAKPSISYEGETTVTLPGSFSIQFTLKNYDGACEWSMTPSECGSIDQNGLYTWTPTHAGTNSITVEAKADGVLLANPAVVSLTVIDMIPPTEPTLTVEPASVTMAEGEEDVVVTVTLSGAELSDDYPFIYFVDYAESFYSEENPAEFDLAGLGLAAGKTYQLTIAVGNTVDEPLITTVLPVTVTGGEPGPGTEVAITSISLVKGEGANTVTLTIDKQITDFTVKRNDDLTDDTGWSVVEGASITSGKAEFSETGTPVYYRIGDPQ